MFNVFYRFFLKLSFFVFEFLRLEFVFDIFWSLMFLVIFFFLIRCLFLIGKFIFFLLCLFVFFSGLFLLNLFKGVKELCVFFYFFLDFIFDLLFGLRKVCLKFNCCVKLDDGLLREFFKLGRFIKGVLVILYKLRFFFCLDDCLRIEILFLFVVCFFFNFLDEVFRIFVICTLFFFLIMFIVVWKDLLFCIVRFIFLV